MSPRHVRPRRVAPRALLVAAAILAAGMVASAQAAAHAPLHPDALVAGKRVDAYPALWWQWVNRKRWGAQAFQDPTGAQCALNQSGPVWFLAGTDGTDEVRRHCRIPAGKHVFLPLITMLENAVHSGSTSCAQLHLDAAANNNHVVATDVRVDGVRIDIHALRMAGTCFDAYANADYREDDERAVGVSATDGYWLMLAPLADGSHTIQVHVRYDNPGVALGDMEQVFEYQLDVGGSEPAPPAQDEDDDSSDHWLQT